MKKQSVWVYDPVHGQNFYFLVGFTRDQVSKFMRSKLKLNECPPEPQGSGGMTAMLPGGILVWIIDPTLSVLFHEITHATFFSLLSRGYCPTLDDHEEVAYMNMFLLKEFLKGFKGSLKKA